MKHSAALSNPIHLFLQNGSHSNFLTLFLFKISPCCLIRKNKIQKNILPWVRRQGLIWIKTKERQTAVPLQKAVVGLTFFFHLQIQVRFLKIPGSTLKNQVNNAVLIKWASLASLNNNIICPLTPNRDHCFIFPEGNTAPSNVNKHAPLKKLPENIRKLKNKKSFKNQIHEMLIVILRTENLYLVQIKEVINNNCQRSLRYHRKSTENEQCAECTCWR